MFYALLILLTAALAALFLAAIAHYDMGMSREAIRAAALGMAGFLSAVVVLVAVFKRTDRL